MATYFRHLIFVCLIACSCSHSYASNLRQKVQSIYLSQVGVREATGKNDGPQVEAYLRSVGLKKGNPYCAAFVHWCLSQLNIKCPKSGFCPDWFKSNLIYKRGGKLYSGAYPVGSIFGIYFQAKKRIAHVGFINGEQGKFVLTVEGNTNAQGSRDGNGVFKRLRPKLSLFAISDYIE